MGSKNKNKKKNNKTEKVSKVSLQKTVTDYRNLRIGAAIIAVLTFLVYIPVFSNGFVNLDDDRYIENQHLIRSFDIGAIFGSNGFVMGNYHPLVMLVYTIIYHFFELNPVAYHTVNLLIHLVNSCLVMWLMYKLNNSVQVSFVVGLLFGIHPLHVESVAWASELKDLMYTLGFLLSLIYYIRYVKENKNRKLYLLSLSLFIFSLFSKAMGASLTVVLFLVDYYLGRKLTTKTVVEKIPFFVLSVVFGIIAIIAQRSLGAIQEIGLFSFTQRIAFACYGFITYIVRIFLPFNLNAYNGYPVKTGDSIPSVYYIYPLILLVLLAGVFYSLRKTRTIFFGIGFYAVTVFLVLQLLPVGGAVTADRYSYIPSIGIFFLIAYGLMNYLGTNQNYNQAAKAILIVLFAFFSFKTFNQVKLWKDGMTLWSNVIDNQQTIDLAYNNRGVLYKTNNEFDKAMSDYRKSLELNPRNSDTWSNIGLIYWHNGNVTKGSVQKARLYDTALYYMNRAIEIDPQFAPAYSNRGSIYYTMGRQDDALNDISKSLELNPYFAESYYNRGIIYYNKGRKEEACADLKRGAELGYQQSANAYRDLCLKDMK